MRKLCLLSLLLLALLLPLYSQQRVSMRNTHERVVAIVPMIGTGTDDDPRRPMFAPLKADIAARSGANAAAAGKPTGAVTSYTYNNAARTATATTNGGWTRTTTDGLGRTIKVETGHGSTTVSIVDTEYDSCGCSPLGKVKRTSLPYAPGGTVVSVT
jgi:hypothetical protein